ncbi:MAG: MBL fold metallo-hydrolase, partial [Pseudomonadales bacterium]|nr:MBL fold metallo-hydrolase [Pseudomonadales bacterium]
MKLFSSGLVPVASLASVLVLGGCSERDASSLTDYAGSGPKAGEPQALASDQSGFTVPSTFTTAANQAVLEQLPFADQQDFEDAQRGLIASPQSLVVLGAQGELLWNQDQYDFIEGDAPASVNPSLWRQAQLNNVHGLFEVTRGVYQLRGFDLANLTVIEGDTGLIVVDPLTTRETAAQAWAFYREQRGDKPIVAIIFTHSHVDHFGGVFGVISAADASAQGVR